MGLFDDDKFMDDEDYLLSRTEPEEYDSIEDYELEHGELGGSRKYKYDEFDDDDDDDDDDDFDEDDFKDDFDDDDEDDF